MKKFLWIAGGFTVLQLINSEVLSMLVLVALAWWGLAKFFPEMMEGTK